MILLGMTGPIGHGKTTLANALAKLEPNTVHLETSMVIIEVANALQQTLKKPFDPYDVDALNEWLKALPDVLDRVLHVKCSYEQIKLDPIAVVQHPVEYQKLILHAENVRRDFRLARQKINQENKESYRPLLQWLGGYLVSRVDSGIWYKELVRRIRQVERAGCQLCIVGGLRFPTDGATLREEGGIIIKVYRPGYLQNDMLDPTERERENITVDSTIMSNGTIEDVGIFAMHLLEDLRSGELQTLYQVKPA